MFDREINQIRENLTDIYKDLHRHPELGFNEHRTAAVIADYLKDCRLHVETQHAITGVIGILDSGKPGKTLLMRADMDCLSIAEQTGCDYASIYPERMHACGHDLHVAMLLGAAHVLSEHRSDFCGKIKFVFEPAEEGLDPSILEKIHAANCQAGGARALVDEGILSDVDFCFAIHNEPALPVGTVSIAQRNAYASSDVFQIEILGKGGHGARPHLAIDPTPAAAEIIQSLYSLQARELNCLEPAVISVGQIETPGSVWNSIPERILLSGGFRTFSDETRDFFYKRLPEIARQIATAHRCDANVSIRHGLDPTRNDTVLVRKIADACRSLLGNAHVDDSALPTMASESVGTYFCRKPGVILRLGSGDPEHELHNPHMLPDLNTLPIGIQVHLAAALALLK